MTDNSEELIHLQQLVAEQEAQIAELKRQLERQQVHSSVFGVDAIRKYDEAMARFQTARDDARRELEAVRAAIKDYGINVVIDDSQAAKAYRSAEAEFEEISDAAKSGKIAERRIANVLHDATRKCFEEAQACEAAVINVLNERRIQVSDTYQRTLAELMIIKQRIYKIAVLDYGTKAALYASALESTPETTCALIWHDLRVSGRADLSLLEKLPIDWVNAKIKNDFPNPPKSWSTAAGYLNLAAEHAQSGRSIVNFQVDEGKYERTLKRAIAYYRAFEQIARG